MAKEIAILRGETQQQKLRGAPCDQLEPLSAFDVMLFWNIPGKILQQSTIAAG